VPVFCGLLSLGKEGRNPAGISEECVVANFVLKKTKRGFCFIRIGKIGGW
jgi:hypothetical protein